MTTPVVTVEIAVVSGLIGAIGALVLKHLYDKWQSYQTRRRRFGALKAEIDYCARLARTYGTDVAVPLYRFPSSVFETVYPHLIGDVLSGTDVQALIGFYSQAEQMNRGLDAAEGYRAANNGTRMDEEVHRLRLKAAEMQHPEDISERGRDLDFYAGAIAAVNRHLR
jgi:hypothetical protein